MKKIIKQVDEERKITQITISDERWYEKDDKFVPSSTWICSYYPKGTAFYKWLAEKGWDEAEAIKQASGERGDKIHQAIEKLIKGETIKMDSKFLNKNTGQDEELTLDEYQAILSFVDWKNEVNPTFKEVERVVFSDKYNYAGTRDIVCDIDGQEWIVDIKSGSEIWPEYELQISSYKYAEGQNPDAKLAILQVGYKRNKIKKYKFTEVEDKFDLFLAIQKIWADRNVGVSPKTYELPTEISL
jgi:hypothetical protein